jgi:hypothetical protein
VSVTDGEYNPITNLRNSNFYIEPVISPAYGSYYVTGQNGWDGYPRSFRIEPFPRGVYHIRIAKFDTRTGEDPPEWNAGIYAFFIEITTNIKGREARGRTFVTSKFDTNS